MGDGAHLRVKNLSVFVQPGQIRPWVGLVAAPLRLEHRMRANMIFPRMTFVRVNEVWTQLNLRLLWDWELLKASILFLRK